MGSEEVSDREAIARTVQDVWETEDDGALLIGYVAVTEWVRPDGSRFLSMMGGDGSGGDVPLWQIRGYLHEGLYEWPHGDDDDMEDE